ncbi:MAG: FAD-dependent oxidoreductase [Lachnospiraceae bacterium]|uniref:FAD-dependent oxidoreductase n=1 Tax=Candidatus Weimeria bifida TaxID=2599074 RepID=A0A6N7IWH4_9FIRM|nr:FAD-dependent oxidoreductase [Candidatus Weimeria bifida]RRF96046.1 MAG: FAD-dependent oxidoreductase [Lachnospiraceae bacterium]
MSIQIDQIKISPEQDSREALLREAAKRLHISKKDITDLCILKKSIDARKKPDVFLLYQIAVRIKGDESKILKNHRIKNIAEYQKKTYNVKRGLSLGGRRRPVIVGLGPAGLFAGLILSEAGLCPVILERGKQASERRADVEKFFETGVLDPESNVQFGEGGAGTFSDGKLNTGVHDKNGRNHFILETFVKYGAPPEILYEAKPHIGTDKLIDVVSNIRKAIIEKGGEVRFETKMTGLIVQDGRVSGVKTVSENSSGQNLHEDIIPTDSVILAIGHSARDTFKSLYEEHIPMTAKQFAMGFRIEHPQKFIDESQYGSKAAELLPAAPYKLAFSKGDRGVYSFCMCPGGFVVNASSEEGRLAVNGMSNYRRDSANANSAIVVAVGAGEYDMNDPLGAIAYQRSIEKKAYDLCRGKIPQQLYGNFKENKVSTSYGDFESLTKGAHAFANLRGIYSPEIEQAFINGMDFFDRRIHGFARYDAILSGVESRTSSPVRIPRDESFQSSLRGLFPCGEGAGYAGGITSAAIDGIKVAEAVTGSFSQE